MGTATVRPVAPAPRSAPAAPPRPRPSLLRLSAWAVLLVLLGLGTYSLSIYLPTPATLIESQEDTARFLEQMVPLDFSEPGKLVESTLLTLAIVILGTLLAAILSLPVAYLAAGNTSPHPTLRYLARGFGVVCRALPDVVLAMVFATMFSLGALPGILALGIHSIGMISRMFADAIEQVDDGPRLAVRATGAGRLQEFLSGVLPQAMPSFIATTLHRNDINLRASAILGYAGVAGLGMDLRFALQTLDYRRAMAVALIMFLLCVVMEAISATVRSTMLAGVEGARQTWADKYVARRDAGRARKATAAGRPAPGARVADRREHTPQAWLRRPWDQARIQSTLGLLAFAAVVAAAFWFARIAWSDFLNLGDSVPRTAEQFWPPSLGIQTWADMQEKMLETILIALGATVLSLVFSLLIGSFAASNVAPGKGVRGLARLLLVVVRGLPELVVAIVLIIMTGLGSPAGMLAMGLCGIGLLGKLWADSLEEIPHGPERSLRATGATRSQVFVSSTMPLATPPLIGHFFYMLDSNVRNATILGIVGGGGIGYTLFEAAQTSQYQVVTAVCLMVLAVVLVIEMLSIWVRKVLA